MSERSVFIVAGLGFGDEGKGTVTEYLAHAYNTNAVVRYNGGPQAAHHVVQANGDFHCFSQFASGCFLDGVRSHLAHTVLVKPSNLLVEQESLSESGLSDIASRSSLDPDCFLVTPWHAMLCRMEEVARGASPHGSVGMGVGKAAYDRRTANPNALKANDLINREQLKNKLYVLWEEASTCAHAIIAGNHSNRELMELFDSYRERTPPEVMYTEYCSAGERLHDQIASDRIFADGTAGNLVLEGAQGVLLDCLHGFLPHVTKTDTTFKSAASFIERANFKNSQIIKVGVLRAYATRHGAGPFVTEDNSLKLRYPEAHNDTHRWQGAFRVGHFDLVASRYALKVSGMPDFLAITQLDLVGRQDDFSLCNSYLYKGAAHKRILEEFFELDSSDKRPVIAAIKFHEHPSETHQSELTKLLADCVPNSFITFDGWGELRLAGSLDSNPKLKRFIEYLESPSGLGCPVRVLSFGPTLADKAFLK